jgi:hypothetical protein
VLVGEPGLARVTTIFPPVSATVPFVWIVFHLDGSMESSSKLSVRVLIAGLPASGLADGEMLGLADGDADGLILGLRLGLRLGEALWPSTFQ